MLKLFLGYFLCNQCVLYDQEYLIEKAERSLLIPIVKFNPLRRNILFAATETLFFTHCKSVTNRDK